MIRAARGERTQIQFASVCEVSQVTISRWESGVDEPTSGGYARLARVSSQPYRKYFLEKSGFADLLDEEAVPSSPPPTSSKDPSDDRDKVRAIPLISDGFREGKMVETIIPLPDEWFSDESELWTVRIDDKSVVVLDKFQRNPELLLNQPVVCRVRDRVSVGQIRRAGTSHVFLPEKASFSNSIEFLKPKGEASILGSIVFFVQTPVVAVASND
jgi:transcriptional regulator with XRE-family HTH domain